MKTLKLGSKKPLFFYRATSNHNVTTNNNSSTVSEKETHEVIDSIVNSDGGLLSKDHFVVVSTFDELPSAIKNAAKDQDAENSIGGVYHNGKTYFLLSGGYAIQSYVDTIKSGYDLSMNMLLNQGS
jgi:hypothetical protein